jgi:hypothetical protein
MADRLDVLKRAILLIGTAVGDIAMEDVLVGGVSGVDALARDELDRLDKTAGCLAFPNLTETALAKRFKKTVARQRFRVGL